ncbi:hypothetical protein [Methylobacterium trifolii]|uniref:hypothetical protein n=1 Tax=Methylobacterium trifolii TaxID=1003092 RepID=UPI001EDFA679|nr:hypothetical protein [Methylobacterium trifolii]
MSVELIEAILQEVWADEVDILGSATVRDISTHAGEDNVIYKTAGGHPFDAGSAAHLLVEAATLVKISIEIYRLLKRDDTEGPADAELKEKILEDNRVAKLQNLVKEKITDIIKILKG